MSASKKRRNPDKEEMDDDNYDQPPFKKRRTYDDDGDDESENKNTETNESSPPSDDSDQPSDPSSNEEKEDEEEEYMHHPGTLDVDYDGDFWADWDEECHGVIDSNAQRREYPGGFKWSCCGATGDEDGCTVRSREATPIAEQYATSPEPSLDEEEYHHPGYLEVDWDTDFWADHDEECHGIIDTKTNRREYPEGFKWSCCGEIGTFAEGCVRV